MENGEARVLAAFPPRAITPPEVELFRQWLSRAGDIPLAYVSERRSDDPRLYRRIVIKMDPDREPMCTVHAPSVGSRWIVTFLGRPYSVAVYKSLQDALNSIAPVLF